MSDDRRSDEEGGTPKGAARFIGSLRDALAAAGREEPPAKPLSPPLAPPAGAPPVIAPPLLPAAAALPGPSAAEAAREARGGADRDRHVEVGSDATRVVRATRPASSDSPRTQLVRGKSAVKRSEFFQDPVVGWLVVVGGPGLGAFRPIYEGNNTVGRAATQRIPIDFGDDTISSEEQAYVRYDSADRKFLLVPNLAKTNVVAVNDKKPTGAVELAAMDLITMGRTQLVFVPFCGADFDWAELSELK